MALFAPVARTRNANLVEFRAGKMTLKSNNMVHPDKRKGLVYIIQSEDGLMHFCWKDRNTGAVEEDLIIFPGDASFTKVSQCTTGRVFLLKIKPQRKLFFWMQEPKSDKDDEHCQKINDLLNHPPTPGTNAGRGARGAGIEGGALPEGFGGGALDSDLLQNALGSMDHNQLYQLLNLMGGSGGNLDPSALLAGLTSARGAGSGATGAATTTAARSAPVSAAATVSASGSTATNASAARRQVVDLAQFQNILSGISVPEVQQQEQMIELEEVLTVDRVAPAISANSDYVNRLFNHLPYEPSIEQAAPQDEIVENLRSPPFRQAVGIFGNALQTGQLGSLLRQFDVSPAAVVAADKGDVQSFAKALESAEGAAVTHGEGAAGQAAGSAAGGSAQETQKQKSGSGDKPVESKNDDDEKDISDELRPPPPKKDKPDQEGMDLD